MRMFQLLLCGAACVLFGRYWESLTLTAYAVPGKDPVKTKREPKATKSVAVLDVARIFEEEAALKRQVDALQRDLDKAESYVKSRRSEYADLNASLQHHHPSTGEYRAIKQKMEKLDADLAIHINLQKRQFVDRQGVMYGEAFERIQSKAKTLCDDRRINLALRLIDNPFDRSDPKAIFANLNKTVIYHDGIDITDDVIQALNGE
jgi:Skp family chaperone for outer membrane proteins